MRCEAISRYPYRSHPMRAYTTMSHVATALLSVAASSPLSLSRALFLSFGLDKDRWRVWRGRYSWCERCTSRRYHPGTSFWPLCRRSATKAAKFDFLLHHPLRMQQNQFRRPKIGTYLHRRNAAKLPRAIRPNVKTALLKKPCCISVATAWAHMWFLHTCDSCETCDSCMSCSCSWGFALVSRHPLNIWTYRRQSAPSWRVCGTARPGEGAGARLDYYRLQVNFTLNGVKLEILSDQTRLPTWSSL